MSRKRFGDLPNNLTSEELRFAKMMGMMLSASGVSVPSSGNPNHNRNICVLWSLGCIGALADFFTSEYQGRLRQTLINKFAIGGTTSIVQFHVYADTTKLTVPDQNFPRPVPEGGCTITVGEDWTFTIHHSRSADEAVLPILGNAVFFSSFTEAPFLCLVSDDGCADFVSAELKDKKFNFHDINVSEECMRKRPADRFPPMPAECTSYYGPLEILKDCIKRTQRKYKMERVQLNSVRQLFDQLGTGVGFENIARDAESAGAVAVTRAENGKEWISLTAGEHNEVTKDAELVPPEVADETPPRAFPQTDDVYDDVYALCEHWRQAAAAQAFSQADTNAENAVRIKTVPSALRQVAADAEVVLVEQTVHRESSASQPIENETWSVTVRFNPSFECYDQLNAFRLDSDEPSLQVSTKPERRGDWKCVTIQPFDSKDDAENFASHHFEILRVTPKINRLSPSRLSEQTKC